MREREKRRREEKEKRERVTSASLFYKHLSQRKCVGVVCGQVKACSCALCKSEVHTQIDTLPQPSQLVDSADEAKTVSSAYKVLLSLEKNSHLANQLWCS